MSNAAVAETLPGLVFRARGSTKVYHIDDLEVHALCGVDLDLFEGELVVLQIIIHPSDQIHDGVRVSARR